MPQKEIQVNNWVIDPLTGFLTSLDSRHKFTSQTKKEFLTKLLEIRDVADACKATGINRRILTSHLRADKAFKFEYEAAKRQIKNPEEVKRLEAVERLWKKTQR